MRQLTEEWGFNNVVEDFNSLTDVTVLVQANLPLDAPKFEHFIDLDILLAGIRHGRKHRRKAQFIVVDAPCNATSHISICRDTKSTLEFFVG